MYGIKITKTLWEGDTLKWPGEYRRLDAILRPVGDDLRPLWWAAGAAHYQDWPMEGEDGREPPGGPSYDRFAEQFVPGTDQGAALPGFLPAYAAVVSGDWSILYGLPANPANDPAVLTGLGTLGWFCPPSAFPPEVSVVIRGIDWAYWEVFARDWRLIAAVREHLAGVPGLRLDVPDGAHGPG